MQNQFFLNEIAWLHIFMTIQVILRNWWKSYLSLPDTMHHLQFFSMKLMQLSVSVVRHVVSMKQVDAWRLNYLYRWSIAHKYLGTLTFLDTNVKKYIMVSYCWFDMSLLLIEREINIKVTIIVLFYIYTSLVGIFTVELYYILMLN